MSEQAAAGGFDPWSAGASFAGQAMGGSTKSSSDTTFDQNLAFDNAFNVTFGNDSPITAPKTPLISAGLPGWQTAAGLAVAGLVLVVILKRLKK